MVGFKIVLPAVMAYVLHYVYNGESSYDAGFIFWIAFVITDELRSMTTLMFVGSEYRDFFSVHKKFRIFWHLHVVKQSLKRNESFSSNLQHVLLKGNHRRYGCLQNFKTMVRLFPNSNVDSMAYK
jgi:hypothetical protein